MTEIFIARKFMLKGTEKGTFSPMTLFAWLGIGIALPAMACLLSVMYGFESALKERVLTAHPHVLVHSKNGKGFVTGYERWTPHLLKVAGVERAVPFVETEMIIQAPYRTLGAVVLGLPIEELAFFQKGILKGQMIDPKSDRAQIIVGNMFAERMALGVHDDLRIVSPLQSSGPMGMIPKTWTYEASAIYKSGHYDFDQQYVILLLQDAQDLLGRANAISGWRIWAKDFADADELAANIQKILPPDLQAQSWTVLNAALFQSLKLEQYAMFFVLSFAIAIAAMNTVIPLTMYVARKRKNIGILVALGATRSRIHKIFLWQGVLIGMVGISIGALLTVGGIVFIRFFLNYSLPDIYYDQTIPVEVRPLSILLIFAIATVLIFAATLYPAARAAAVDPLEAIKD